MSHAKAKIVRKNVTFSSATIRRLEELVRTGAHGSDVVAVIRTLVDQGIRKAMRDGFLDR